ncbi:TetR/AcrR family transcriptional regulator [Cognatiyoonia sp. IB215182]|uniref:TetR/AcrR family transcriptional regulator n=1 Tax=Cognatiyoonia sp. IB215182 TaxID=3097353 RepID=UPI002A165908|nr:TetR/AcrR family transcriptional regulator [Cognatiyoonia sp. IB215182]MDX8352603.1 TetR/AcrR family transcriptional regulator [Cognatiyoonia sp. IB215182]
MNDRLSRKDWLKHGLRALVVGGPGTLKADVLAKQLGVSRGSFYWHFRNLADFHDALLAYWQTTSTQAVIEGLTADVPQKDRLFVLVQRALSADTSLERAMRLWAANAPAVASVLAEVDRERINYLGSLLTEHDVSTSDAVERAKLIYWTYLGRMDVAAKDQMNVSDQTLAAFVAAMQD